MRRPRFRFAAAPALACLALTGAAAHATSQGPVADGPYVGTLPCADCAGIRTSLTLYTMGQGGLPLVYRMTRVYLGTPAGDRGEEYIGPWSRIDAGAGETLRIEPHDDARRSSFRRADVDRLVLLDRSEQPIATRQDLALVRDPGADAARLTVPRTLFRGTLQRDAGKLRFAPCGGGKPFDARDVSAESVITAAVTDAGFDTHGAIYLEALGRAARRRVAARAAQPCGARPGLPDECARRRRAGQCAVLAPGVGPPGGTLQRRRRRAPEHATAPTVLALARRAP